MFKVNDFRSTADDPFEFGSKGKMKVRQKNGSPTGVVLLLVLAGLSAMLASYAWGFSASIGTAFTGSIGDEQLSWNSLPDDERPFIIGAMIACIIFIVLAIISFRRLDWRRRSFRHFGL